MLPVFEFFETTKSLGCSRILLRDQYRQFYHRGIDSQRPDFDSLVAYLREEIARLSPKKVMCIGTSSGGYAAILAGHRLRADYVHAFAPQTSPAFFNPGVSDGSQRLSHWMRTLSRLSKREFIDLAQVLQESNGKTTYFIHYCRGIAIDRQDALHLAGLPAVVTLGYPCESHFVVISLAMKGFLQKALEIDHQHKLAEMARAHFPGTLEINEGPPHEKHP
jgi:hypothetical protein